MTLCVHVYVCRRRVCELKTSSLGHISQSESSSQSGTPAKDIKPLFILYINTELITAQRIPKHCMRRERERETETLN